MVLLLLFPFAFCVWGKALCFFCSLVLLLQHYCTLVFAFVLYIIVGGRVGCTSAWDGFDDLYIMGLVH